MIFFSNGLNLFLICNVRGSVYSIIYQTLRCFLQSPLYTSTISGLPNGMLLRNKRSSSGNDLFSVVHIGLNCAALHRQCWLLFMSNILSSEMITLSITCYIYIVYAIQDGK